MRRYRDTPYGLEHDASLRRKAQPPKNLLGWFLEGFRAEMPTDIHAGQAFIGQQQYKSYRQGGKTIVQAVIPSEQVGGSLLGSPGTDHLFRRFLEDSPFACETAEYEGHKDITGHYVFPMRAALARLAGRGPDTDPYPFMARALYRTALRDGDWDGACASLGIVEPVRKVYIEEALRRLWHRYEVEPPARTIRTSEAA